MLLNTRASRCLAMAQMQGAVSAPIDVFGAIIAPIQHSGAMVAPNYR